MKQIIIRFLKLNGFEKVEPNSYVLHGYNVTLNGEVILADSEGNEKFFGSVSNNLTLFALIGYLTYTGIISKLYKS